MDTVVLDGVQYVKASVLAKKFRYTADYVGQLCRAKKIDARLVGRTWFVNPESVQSYRLNKRKATSKVATTDSTVPNKTKPSRKAVLPVVQNKTAKSTTNIAIEVDGVSTRKLAVAYEPDDETLIPNLIKKKVGPAKTIRIEQANAKKIKVAGKKTKFSFQAGELPEVSLSGKLRITTFSDSEPEPDTNQAHAQAKKPSPKKESRKKVVPPKSEEEVKLKVKEADFTPAVSKKINNPHETTENLKVSPVAKPTQNQPESKNEESVAPEPVNSDVVLPVVAEVPTALLISPLIATILGLICVLVILSASTQVVVFDSGYDSQVILQVANLLEILNL